MFDYLYLLFFKPFFFLFLLCFFFIFFLFSFNIFLFHFISPHNLVVIVNTGFYLIVFAIHYSLTTNLFFKPIKNSP
ncbi:MAG TPA: hypothetical protein ENI51_05350 [Candidatus Atribacteria bacterium]|nr:hypothetical protein [Candidatus Atribacteria bacterium]